MSKHGGKVKQEKKILLLALYLLRKKWGFREVPKSQALKFIELRGLMTIPPEDLEKRTPTEAKWENDIAWRRQDLVEDGLMTMRYRDEWAISDRGVESIEEWARKIKAFTEQRPDWREALGGIAEDGTYLNPTTIEWLLAIEGRLGDSVIGHEELRPV